MVNLADCGSDTLCRKCVKCLMAQLEQAEATVKGHSERRDRVEQACNAYWHDLFRIAGLCGMTDDEYPLRAVERVVKERDELLAKQDKLYTSQHGALAEVTRREVHQRAYNCAFLCEIERGKSDHDAHEIARKVAHWDVSDASALARSPK